MSSLRRLCYETIPDSSSFFFRFSAQGTNFSTFFDTVPSLLGFRMYSHHLCGSSSRAVHLGLPLCVFPFIPPSRISFNIVSPHITRPIHHPPSLLWIRDRSDLLRIDDSNMKAVSSLYMQLLLLLLLLVTVWPARVSGDHSGLGRIPQATRRRTSRELLMQDVLLRGQKAFPVTQPTMSQH